MRVTFVYPDIIGMGAAWKGMYSFGVGSLISALQEANHRVSLLHLRHPVQRKEYLKMLSSTQPELVAFSTTSLMFPFIQAWSLWTKEGINKATVCGGIHPTLFPEEVIQDENIDFICRGEGETAIVELCNRIEKRQDLRNINNIWGKENGEIFKNEVSLPVDLNRLSFPNRSLFDFPNLYETKKGVATFMASRGCSFDCNYCLNHALKNVYEKETSLYVRLRNVNNIVAEIKKVIKEYPFIKKVLFHDDIFPLETNWLSEFAAVYRKQIGLPFICNIRPGLIEKEILLFLKKAGCGQIMMGIESGNEKIRTQILNRHISQEVLAKTVNMCKEAGIKILSFNMLGIPNEEMSDILETIKLNARLGIDRHRAFIFYPFRKTYLYDYCQNKGLLNKRLVRNINDDIALKCNLLLRNQILFSQRFFSILVILYRKIYNLPQKLMIIMEKIIDKILTSRFFCSTISPFLVQGLYFLRKIKIFDTAISKLNEKISTIYQ